MKANSIHPSYFHHHEGSKSKCVVIGMQYHELTTHSQIAENLTYIFLHSIFHILQVFFRSRFLISKIAVHIPHQKTESPSFHSKHCFGDLIVIKVCRVSGIWWNLVLFTAPHYILIVLYQKLIIT